MELKSVNNCQALHLRKHQHLQHFTYNCKCLFEPSVVGLIVVMAMLDYSAVSSVQQMSVSSFLYLCSGELALSPTPTTFVSFTCLCFV